MRDWGVSNVEIACALGVALLVGGIAWARYCPWRAGAGTAAFTGAITAVGTLTPWWVKTGMDAMYWRVDELSMGIDSVNGKSLLGAYVLLLGVLGGLAGLVLAVRSKPPSRGLALFALCAHLAATGLVARDALHFPRSQWQNPPGGYVASGDERTGWGLWLTGYAAFVGACSAGGLLLRLRAGLPDPRPRSHERKFADAGRE